MFNNSSEEFFNEKLDDDDFPSEFFLQPENHLPSSHPQPPILDNQNQFNFLLENDHFSMDLTAVKNLKSQIINSDLLIENNERLKKKMQELEIENKELKLLNIKAKDQEHQRFITLESKLKAAEMMNLQFKEQLSYHSKENNPQITALRDKIKQHDKIIKSKDDEIRRRDEELRHKDSMLDEMRRVLNTLEAELKSLKEQKIEVKKPVTKNEAEKKPLLDGFKLKKAVFIVKKKVKKLKSHYMKNINGIKEELQSKKKENDELKGLLENFKGEFERIREKEDETIKEKIGIMKEEVMKELPKQLMELLKNNYSINSSEQQKPKNNEIQQIFNNHNNNIKMEIEEKPKENISSTMIKLEMNDNLIKKNMNIDQKDNIFDQKNIELKNKETTPQKSLSLEPSQPKPETPKPNPESLKKSALPLNKKPKKPSENPKNPKKTLTRPDKNPLNTEMDIIISPSLENFDSDSKIRKVPKKQPLSFATLLDDLLNKSQSIDPKTLLQSLMPLYFKKLYIDSKKTTFESFKKPLFSILTLISQGIFAQDLLEFLQETSQCHESFETSLALEEFFDDINKIPEEPHIIRLIEGIKESLKTPYVVGSKWAMKTRNARYLTEEKKLNFIEFIKKIVMGGLTLYFPFDRLLEELNEFSLGVEGFNDHVLRGLQSLSPLSFQLNNDLLDLLVVSLIKGFQRKGQEIEVSRFLYDLLTSKFCVPRTEILLNLIYSVILLSPKSLQVIEKEGIRTFDLGWILQIGTNQSYCPPYGPLTLQAIRLCIVDTCNHWKILNRSSQNAYLQTEFNRKTLFILLRLYDLLEIGQSSDVLFGLFNYESIKESFQEGLNLNNKSINNAPNKIIKEDWPWFKGLPLDPMFMSSLLTNNLISILDKTLFPWDGLLLNNTVNLKGALDLNDIIATMGIYMGYQPFCMTGQLQKNFFGFIYNKKYDLTFQRTLSLLCLSMMSRAGDKDIIDVLIGIVQERIQNIRVSSMDKVAALFCLWKKFGVNLRELIEQNKGNLNPFVLELMNFLAFNKKPSILKT